MKKPIVTLEAMAGTLKVNGQKKCPLRKKALIRDEINKKSGTKQLAVNVSFVNKSNSFLKSSYRVEC